MKRLLLILGIPVATVIVAALVAPYFISSEEFKQELSLHIEKGIGYKTTIAGELKIRIFPFIGATAGDVTVAGFSGGKPLMKLKSMNVNIELIPLFTKGAVVAGLTFKEPQIHLEVNQAGKSNWELIGEAVAANAPATENKGKGAKPIDPGMMLGSVEISNGAVTYDNRQTGDRWNLGRLNMEASLRRANAPLVVEGSAEWNGKPVKTSLKLDSLQSWLDKESAAVGVSVESDLATFTASGQLKQKSYAGKIDILSLGPGKLKAAGDVKARWGSARPYVELNLATDKLDLNPFLAAEKHASNFSLVSSALAATGETWSSDPIDFSALKSFDGAVNIQAGEILAQKMVIGKAVLKAKLENGQLATDMTEADFYGGKLSAAATANIGEQGIALSKRVSLKGVQAEPFMKAAANDDRLSGTLNMQMNVTGSGKSQREIVSSLGGNGDVKITDGAIRGFDIANMVRNIQSAYKDVNSGSQKTDFAELGGTFTIAQGVVSNSDLAMKAPLMRLTGKGQINLNNLTILYRLEPQIVETIQGQGGKEKAGLGVPVIVEGSLNNPTFRPDLESVVKEAIQDPEKLKERVKGAKETLKDVKGLLKGFR